jgi:hypothetical protein
VGYLIREGAEPPGSLVVSVYKVLAKSHKIPTDWRAVLKSAFSMLLVSLSGPFHA